jgi:hypothetical protein
LTRHNGLPAFGHRDVLDDDPLRAAGAKPLHGRHPGLIGARHPGNGARQSRALDVRSLSRFIVVPSRFHAFDAAIELRREFHDRRVLRCRRARSGHSPGVICPPGVVARSRQAEPSLSSLRCLAQLHTGRVAGCECDACAFERDLNSEKLLV